MIYLCSYFTVLNFASVGKLDIPIMCLHFYYFSTHFLNYWILYKPVRSNYGQHWRSFTLAILMVSQFPVFTPVASATMFVMSSCNVGPLCCCCGLKSLLETSFQNNDWHWVTRYSKRTLIMWLIHKHGFCNLTHLTAPY